MGKLTILIVVTCISVALSTPNMKTLLSNVERINSLQSSWKASITPVSLLSEAEQNRLVGSIVPTEEERRRMVKTIDVGVEIPVEFDAREKWSACPSIWSIKDQGHCGDCWAVATASAASDRLCIISNYNVQVNLSAENLMTCCHNCTKKGGCNGGKTHKAWTYIEDTGIVTGGDYDSDEGCQPYEIPPSASISKRGHLYTPPCVYNCTNPDYPVSYDDDLYYGNSSYVIEPEVSQIQTDLETNGPNVASMVVYEDFHHYTSGVYHHVWGKRRGRHAVRILGWGTDSENGEPFWFVANSWNRTFGLNGYFKIRRVTNGCEFEKHVCAGIMLP